MSAVKIRRILEETINCHAHKNGSHALKNGNHDAKNGVDQPFDVNDIVVVIWSKSNKNDVNDAPDK